MPFVYDDDQRKVRISLSQHAHEVLSEDMQVFGAKLYSSFINEIFENFHDNANASIDVYKTERCHELSEMLRESVENDEERKRIVDCIVNKELIETKKKLRDYLRDKHISNLYYISRKNIAYLTEDCKCEDFYDQTPGRYIKCLLEEYCDLPFLQRSQIYRRKVYDKVQQAIAEKKILKIKVLQSNNKECAFRVYPYRIIPDKMKTRDYLVCYSQAYSDSTTPKQIASFSMIKLTDDNVDLQSGKFYLNKDEINNLEKQIKSKTVSYLIGNTDEPVRVKLTKTGKQIYRDKLFLRPEKAPESTENEYVFHCTEKQAYDYFFSFGKEAEIVTPAKLRDRFIIAVTDMMEVYRTN